MGIQLDRSRTWVWKSTFCLISHLPIPTLRNWDLGGDAARGWKADHQIWPTIGRARSFAFPVTSERWFFNWFPSDWIIFELTMESVDLGVLNFDPEPSRLSFGHLWTFSGSPWPGNCGTWSCKPGSQNQLVPSKKSWTLHVVRSSL